MTESREVMIVRHPQTQSNAAGRYIGRGDSPRTEAGERQLEWLEEMVAFWEPDAVLTSPLGRALDSARRLAPAGTEVQVLDDLQELDFGEAEGHTYDELQAMGIRLDYNGGGPIAPGGETGSEFAARVLRVAATIEGSGFRALVVTHGGVMRRLLVHWLELPELAAWRFDVPNGAAAILRICEGSAVLEELTHPPFEGRKKPRRCKPWHL
ncbi:histidine phosphatase family protein [bacterium]|nr:histidine phosphatase family protein [bacterium]